MAEIQENNSGKGKEGKGKQKKMTIRVDFTPMVDNEHVAHYVLYALYLVEQASDDGN